MHRHGNSYPYTDIIFDANNSNNKSGIQTNEPNNKEIDDNTQGFKPRDDKADYMS